MKNKKNNSILVKNYWQKDQITQLIIIIIRSSVLQPIMFSRIKLIIRVIKDNKLIIIIIFRGYVMVRKP